MGNRHERISLANCNNIAKNGIKPNKYSDFIERFCWKRETQFYIKMHIKDKIVFFFRWDDDQFKS